MGTVELCRLRLGSQSGFGAFGVEVDSRTAQRPRFPCKGQSWAPLVSTDSAYLTALRFRSLHLLGERNGGTLSCSNSPYQTSALGTLASESRASSTDTVADENCTPSSSIGTQREDEKIQRLRDWLLQLGWDACGLAVLGKGVGDYAAYAKEGGVEEGDVIVRVPEAALMTEEVRSRI